MGIDRWALVAGAVAAFGFTAIAVPGLLRPLAAGANPCPEGQPAVNARLGESGPVRLGLATTAVSVGLDAAGAAHARAAVLGAVTPQRLVLVVRGISADPRPPVAFDVFVNLPEGAAADPAGAYHAGVLDFYALGVTRGGAEARFDITALARRRGFDFRRITVSFVASELLRAVQPGVAPERAVDVRIANVAVELVPAPAG